MCQADTAAPGARLPEPRVGLSFSATTQKTSGRLSQGPSLGRVIGHVHKVAAHDFTSRGFA